ncbi:MAG: hypothetical protein HQ464_17530 [Planctomycetes bacterium]|jgi:hypothetical protein|nr:hypothetical protein [Planctomycetota bacterium]
MKLNLIRTLQLFLLTLIILFLSTPPASAGNKWDCSANQINSRGDKLPTARGHHDSDQDDDDEKGDDDEKDDDDCKSKNNCCGKNSCQDKDDDDKK